MRPSQPARGRKGRPFLCPACGQAATSLPSRLLEEADPRVGAHVIDCPQCGEFSIDAAFLHHPQGWSAVPVAKRRALALYLHATQAAAGQEREIDEQNWRALAQKGERLTRKGRKP